MRRKACFLFAMATAVALCQGQTSQSTTDEDELNLDQTVNNASGGRNNVGTSNSNVTECLLKDGKVGVCVLYYLCDPDSRRIIEDGYSIIDIRAQSECSNFLEVCCQRVSPSSESGVGGEGVTNKDTLLPQSTTAFSLDVENNEDTLPSTLERHFPLDNCGFSNPGANVLAIRDGGDVSERAVADFGEFPWMAALLTRSNDTFFGGGSLIHTSVVMTVAHKVMDRKANEIKIRVGEYDTNSDEELYRHQERNVAKIVIHEKFNAVKALNDVALLFLETPVALTANTPNIGIGCLAPQPPPPGTACFSMGWGASNFKNQNVFASIPKKVKLPVLSANQCERMLRRTRLGPRFSLHPSLVCAGGEEGIDTCKGDGGSSLVCPLNNHNSRFAIYGMVAYGVSCGRANVPGVYVNTSIFYDWIGQQISREGLDTKPYTFNDSIKA